MIDMTPPQLRAAPGPESPRLTFQRRFTDAPDSVRAARDYVRDLVKGEALELTPDQVSDMRVVTSELFTNALRYGTEPGDSVLVRVTVMPSAVRVEVHDPVRRRPRRRRASSERGRGRGLVVVDALASAWGVQDRPMGKIVWVVFAW